MHKFEEIFEKHTAFDWNAEYNCFYGDSDSLKSFRKILKPFEVSDEMIIRLSQVYEFREIAVMRMYALYASQGSEIKLIKEEYNCVDPDDASTDSIITAYKENQIWLKEHQYEIEKEIKKAEKERAMAEEYLIRSNIQIQNLLDELQKEKARIKAWRELGEIYCEVYEELHS